MAAAGRAFGAMNLRPIQVRTHSGYKADEEPRRILREGAWETIGEIADRWYQGNRNPEWPVAEYFRVTLVDGATCLLKHDRESDVWFVVE